MLTLITYDNDGYVLQHVVENYRVPTGVPYLVVDIPKDKRLKIDENGIGVDVSVTPHEAILEDIPPSEIDLLRLEMAQANTELFEMVMSMGGTLNVS